MIFGPLRRRRDARLAVAERTRQAGDLFVAAWRQDLDRAFWSAHGRAWDRSTSAPDRRLWLALLREIDGRRPPTRSRADTATRMLFRDHGL